MMGDHYTGKPSL